MGRESAKRFDFDAFHLVAAMESSVLYSANCTFYSVTHIHHEMNDFAR